MTRYIGIITSTDDFDGDEEDLYQLYLEGDEDVYSYEFTHASDAPMSILRKIASGFFWLEGHNPDDSIFDVVIANDSQAVFDVSDSQGWDVSTDEDGQFIIKTGVYCQEHKEIDQANQMHQQSEQLFFVYDSTPIQDEDSTLDDLDEDSCYSDY